MHAELMQSAGRSTGKRFDEPTAAGRFCVRTGLILLLVLVPAILLACGGTPKEGQPAPAFSLPGADGQEVSLGQLLQEHEAVILVFYRGFF